MTDKAYIRVTMAEDGKTPIRELMVDGYRVCDLTFVEVIELIMQASSSLRWGREVVRVPIDETDCAACAGEVEPDCWTKTLMGSSASPSS